MESLEAAGVLIHPCVRASLGTDPGYLEAQHKAELVVTLAQSIAGSSY